MKAKFLFLPILLLSILLFAACTSEGNCTDGEQNNGETGIDCGDAAGLCPPCDNTISCSDGIQNGGETGIDCGGSCPACAGAAPTCTDGQQNGDEEGIDCGGSCPNACDTTTPTCSDGQQNGDEEGIDCGGSCPNPCDTMTPTCSDGQQNGDEEGIDCGGSCPNPCDATPTAKFEAVIDGVFWSATSVTAVSTETPSSITISGITDTLSITLIYTGEFIEGEIPVSTQGTAVANLQQGFDGTNCAPDRGNLLFEEFDTANRQVNGSFEFDCILDNSDVTREVTEGIFENVTYQ